jgi:hypothetical protein
MKFMTASAQWPSFVTPKSGELVAVARGKFAARQLANESPIFYESPNKASWRFPALPPKERQ